MKLWKQIALVSASSLLMLSVGAGVNNVNVNARRRTRTHRVYRHRLYRHRRRRRRIRRHRSTSSSAVPDYMRGNWYGKTRAHNRMHTVMSTVHVKVNPNSVVEYHWIRHQGHDKNYYHINHVDNGAPHLTINGDTRDGLTDGFWVKNGRLHYTSFSTDDANDTRINQVLYR